jgi:hypothetical protein
MIPYSSNTLHWFALTGLDIVDDAFIGKSIDLLNDEDLGW